MLSRAGRKAIIRRGMLLLGLVGLATFSLATVVGGTYAWFYSQAHTSGFFSTVAFDGVLALAPGSAQAVHLLSLPAPVTKPDPVQGTVPGDVYAPLTPLAVPPPPETITEAAYGSGDGVPTVTGSVYGSPPLEPLPPVLPPPPPSITFAVASVEGKKGLSLDLGDLIAGQALDLADVVRLANIDPKGRPLDLALSCSLGPVGAAVLLKTGSGAGVAVALQKGEIAQADLKISTPADIPPGEYTGQLTIKALNGFLLRSLPVRIRILGEG